MNAMSFLQRTVLKIFCGVMAFIMLALLAMSLIFSGAHIAPNLFGTGVFIVKNDAFSLVGRGYALFSKSVPPTDITPGNLVVFRLPGVTAAGQSPVSADLLGEVQDVSSEGGAYTFEIKDENGTRMYITEANLVGKAMSFSAFLGFVISFAVSPAGVTLIAVIPCAIVLALEGTKIFTARQERTERLRPVVRTSNTERDKRVSNKPDVTYKASERKSDARDTVSPPEEPDKYSADSEFELEPDAALPAEPRLDGFSENYYDNALPPKNAGVVAKYVKNTAGGGGAAVRPPKNFSSFEDLNPSERRRRLLSQQRLNEVLAQTRRPNKPRRDNTLDTLKLSELANAREQLLERARMTDVRKEAARGNIDDRAGVSDYKELIAERERRYASARDRTHTDYLDSTSRAAARDVRQEMTDTGRLPALPRAGQDNAVSAVSAAAGAARPAYEWERGETPNRQSGRFERDSDRQSGSDRQYRGVRPPVQLFSADGTAPARDLPPDRASEYEPRVTSPLSGVRRTPVSKAVLAQTSVIPNLDDMLMDEEEAVYR